MHVESRVPHGGRLVHSLATDLCLRLQRRLWRRRPRVRRGRRWAGLRERRPGAERHGNRRAVGAVRPAGPLRRAWAVLLRSTLRTLAPVIIEGLLGRLWSLFLFRRAARQLAQAPRLGGHTNRLQRKSRARGRRDGRHALLTSRGPLRWEERSLKFGRGWWDIGEWERDQRALAER